MLEVLDKKGENMTAKMNKELQEQRIERKREKASAYRKIKRYAAKFKKKKESVQTCIE